MQLLSSSSEVALSATKPNAVIARVTIRHWTGSSSTTRRRRAVSICVSTCAPGVALDWAAIVGQTDERAVKRQTLTRRGASRCSDHMRIVLHRRGTASAAGSTGGIPGHDARQILHHQRRRAPALSGGRAANRSHHRLCARLDHAGVDLAAADLRRLRGAITSWHSIRAVRATRTRLPQAMSQRRRSQDIAELIANLAPVPVLLVGWSLGVLDTLAYVRVARRRDGGRAGAGRQLGW